MQGISWNDFKKCISVHIVDPALYSVGKFVAATFHEFITWITQTCPYLSIWAVQYNFIDKFRIVFVNIVSMFKLIHWSFLLTLCLCFSLLYHDHFVFYYFLWCKSISPFIFTPILIVSTWLVLTCEISFQILYEYYVAFGSTWCDACGTLMALFAVLMNHWSMSGVVSSSHSFLHPFWSFPLNLFPFGIHDRNTFLDGINIAL